MTESHRTLSTGDSLWTPSGGINAVYASAAGELLVVAPGGVAVESKASSEGGEGER